MAVPDLPQRQAPCVSSVGASDAAGRLPILGSRGGCRQDREPVGWEPVYAWRAAAYGDLQPCSDLTLTVKELTEQPALLVC
jgi:hypothetical protein